MYPNYPNDIEMKSTGLKRCEKLIEIMKTLNQTEYSEKLIRDLIAKYIGISELTKKRYMYALVTFNMIKKLDNGNYALT